MKDCKNILPPQRTSEMVQFLQRKGSGFKRPDENKKMMDYVLKWSWVCGWTRCFSRGRNRPKPLSSSSKRSSADPRKQKREFTFESKHVRPLPQGQAIPVASTLILSAVNHAHHLEIVGFEVSMDGMAWFLMGGMSQIQEQRHRCFRGGRLSPFWWIERMFFSPARS